MAGHPAAVRSFLLTLLDAVKRPASTELDGLQRLAQQASARQDGLQAWDQQFYRQLAMVSPILLGGALLMLRLLCEGTQCCDGHCSTAACVQFGTVSCMSAVSGSGPGLIA